MQYIVLYSGLAISLGMKPLISFFFSCLCHALNMMYTQQQPHAQLSVASNMMHTGTN